MGPPMWPWRCGLMARPVSGVEWWVPFARQICHTAGKLAIGLVSPGIHLQAQGRPRKGDEHPSYAALGVWHSLPF